MSELLPPNATALERAVTVAQRHLSELPVDTRHIRNPATCPAPLLPFLAWELSVDEWNPAWGDDVKRRVIAESISVHRRKGTRGAVRRALEALFGDVGFTLVEGAAGGLYEGENLHSGATFYGQAEHWAKYSVYINRPISQQMAADVRRILAAVAPARCHLLALNFEQALNAYDGVIRYDNTYTHGVA
jgi:phage tail P2-like protein